MDIRGKEVGHPKFPKGVLQVPCVHFPKCLHMGTRTFGGKGYLKCPNEVAYHKYSVCSFPQFFQMGSGEIFFTAHLKKFGENGHTTFGVSLFPKCSFAPVRAHL